MGWGNWFGGGSRSDGTKDEASYKFSNDPKDDSSKQESLSRTSESSTAHEHTWSKTSTPEQSARRYGVAGREGVNNFESGAPWCRAPSSVPQRLFTST